MRRAWLAGLLAVPLVVASCGYGAGAESASPAAAPPSAPAPGSGAGGSSPALSEPREDSYYPRVGEPDVDALRYRLDLSWTPHDRTLQGSATLRFRAPRELTSIRLDLGAPLEVGSATLDGETVTVTRPARNALALGDFAAPLAADSTHVLEIGYAGRPAPVGSPTTRADVDGVGWHHARSGGAWAMQEPWGAHTWYPVNDHPSDKAFYDISIETPRAVRGVAGGELLSDRVRDDRRTTRFRLSHPAASYLTTIAIGDYRAYRDRGPHGLPITYWLRPGDREFLPELRRTPAMLRWLEARLGRYPFATAGAVFVPSHSAMETQETVSMGSLSGIRERVPVVLLHEYAHQWYGDTVSPADWRELWLNESFATYVQIHWEADHGGVPVPRYMRYIRSIDNRLRRQDGPPGAYDRREFGDSSVYYSGALMLHELRRRIGGDTFDRALRAWPQRHADASADRGDYIGWLNRFTDRRLRPFMRDWLLSERTPG